MELRCIYRTTTELCSNVRCPFGKFCVKHKNINNVIFDYCIKFLGNKEVLGYYDILVLYKELYGDYGMYEAQCIIGVLISRRKTDLFPIAIDAGLKVRKQSLKKNVLEAFFKKIHNAIVLSNNRKIKKVFSKLWSLWKGYLDRISGRSLGKPVNDTDIFTLDSLDEVKYIFQMVDGVSGVDDVNNCGSKGSVYAFNAISLYKYVQQQQLDENGSILNPYTRSKISIDTQIRLCRYINIIGKTDDPGPDDTLWETTNMAYTDVVIELERSGFYTSVEWFQPLEYIDIVNILKSFHEYCIEYHYDIECMADEDMVNEYPDYIYRFCYLCLNLIRLNNFGYTTVLFRSLMDNVERFRMNSPEWLNNIMV